jgi:hypothetical protein
MRPCGELRIGLEVCRHVHVLERDLDREAFAYRHRLAAPHFERERRAAADARRKPISRQPYQL